MDWRDVEAERIISAGWRSWSDDAEWGMALDRAIVVMREHGPDTAWRDAVGTLAAALWVIARADGVRPDQVELERLLALFPDRHQVRQNAAKLFSKLIADIEDPADPAVRLWTQVLAVDLTPPREMRDRLAEQSDVRWGLAVQDGAASAWTALRRASGTIPEPWVERLTSPSTTIYTLACGACGEQTLGSWEMIEQVRHDGWMSAPTVTAGGELRQRGLCPKHAAADHLAWAERTHGSVAEAWTAAMDQARRLVADDRHCRRPRPRHPRIDVTDERASLATALTALAVHHAAWQHRIPVSQIKPGEARWWYPDQLSLETIPAALAEQITAEALRQIRGTVSTAGTDPWPWRRALTRILNGRLDDDPPLAVSEPPPGSSAHAAWTRAWRMADNYPVGSAGADTFIGGQIIALALVLLTRRLGCTADQVTLDDLADLLDTPTSLAGLLETVGTSEEHDAYLRLDSRHHRRSGAWKPATRSAVEIVIVQMLTDFGLAKPGDQVWVSEEQGDLPTPWRGQVTGAFLHAPFGTATSPRARTRLIIRPETAPIEAVVDPSSAIADPARGPATLDERPPAP